MPEIRVHPVPEGSIVHLHDVGLDNDMAERTVEQIANACGHHQFVLLVTDSGSATVEVWGPDTDLEAKITDLLELADLTADRAVWRGQVIVGYKYGCPGRPTGSGEYPLFLSRH